MDVSQFLLSLLKSLSGLEFVEKVDFKTEVFILKGRANLGGKRYPQVYFNELTSTTAFALIEKGKKFGESESHRSISKKSVQEIVRELSDVWEKLK